MGNAIKFPGLVVKHLMPNFEKQDAAVEPVPSKDKRHMCTHSEPPLFSRSDLKNHCNLVEICNFSVVSIKTSTALKNGQSGDNLAW